MDPWQHCGRRLVFHLLRARRWDLTRLTRARSEGDRAGTCCELYVDVARAREEKENSATRKKISNCFCSKFPDEDEEEEEELFLFQVSE